MNFDFTDDQKELAAQARRLLDAECTSLAIRSVLDGAASYNRPLWHQLGDLGYLGAAIPEDYGGLGLGYFELCVLAEEFGRALAPVPITSSIYLAAEALKAAGSEEQKRTWLPRLASGEAIGTVALAEPGGSRLAETCLSRGKLNGTKTAVPDGAVADLVIVSAIEDDGGAALSLFLVDMRDGSVTRDTVETIDPTRQHATIRFDGAQAERLGPRGEGARLLSDLLDKAAVLIAFEQIGGADRCIESARDYACERNAFGRPIGSFQAIKHMLADMYVGATLARSNAYYGAWALATGAAELPVAAATARVSATQAFQNCARNNIQVHGGNGFTWEFDCHLFYRRSSHLALVLGSVLTWEGLLVQRFALSRAA